KIKKVKLSVFFNKKMNFFVKKWHFSGSIKFNENSTPHPWNWKVKKWLNLTHFLALKLTEKKLKKIWFFRSFFTQRQNAPLFPLKKWSILSYELLQISCSVMFYFYG
ncbi:hypothetical protein C4B25_04795, partial [Mycoplasma todarodis]